MLNDVKTEKTETNEKPSGSIAYMGKIPVSVLLELFINGYERRLLANEWNFDFQI